MCHTAEAVSTKPVLQALNPSDPGVLLALQTRASLGKCVCYQGGTQSLQPDFFNTISGL